MNLGLAGKTVYISGGSGGIGSRIAQQFCEEGANVVVQYHRNRQSAEALVAELGADRSLAVGGDASREDDACRTFAEARDRFGRMDVLVACAGLWPVPHVPIHQMSIEQWRSTQDNNLTSAFLSCREFLKGVAASPFDDPSIVLIGSTAAVFGEAGHGDYASAKSGLSFGLMHSLKNEIVNLAALGRVNSVCPGWTVTPMADKFTGDPASVRRALATIALRKVASPADIANAVLFLASSRVAGHISGQVVTVSGGMEGRLLWSESEVDAGNEVAGN
jgi:3-oxoacyl-[acyl-carrier protein] reductase